MTSSNPVPFQQQQQQLSLPHGFPVNITDEQLFLRKLKRGCKLLKNERISSLNSSRFHGKQGISPQPLGIFKYRLNYKESSWNCAHDEKISDPKFQAVEEEYQFICGKTVKETWKIVIFSAP